jgi:hypothetical protein
MIKKINDPTLQVGDTVKMEYPPQYQQTRTFRTKPIIEGEWQVIEIEGNKLLGNEDEGTGNSL